MLARCRQLEPGVRRAPLPRRRHAGRPPSWPATSAATSSRASTAGTSSRWTRPARFSGPPATRTSWWPSARASSRLRSWRCWKRVGFANSTCHPPSWPSWPAPTPARTCTSGPSRRSSVERASARPCSHADRKGRPWTTLTSVRLTRDGEKPGPIRHQCSGMHAAQLLLARIADWTLEDYWQPDHPVQVATRAVVARVFATTPADLITATDQCGVDTYAFPLRAVAGAFALLADPDALPATDARRSLSAPLRLIRDAMMANPELVGGTRDRLDTSLMKALPGRLVAKGGAEALRGIAVLADRATRCAGLRLRDQGGGRGRLRSGVLVDRHRGASAGRGAGGPATPSARPLPPTHPAGSAREDRRRDSRGVRSGAGRRARALTPGGEAEPAT